MLVMELLYEKETYAIIGAAMEVHKELGYGFLEAVYQEALEIEFQQRGIPYKREQPLTLYYKCKPLNKFYVPDFICHDKIIIELKAVDKIKSEHEGQVVNYLTATKLKLGLILNFGKSSLEHKRIIKQKK